MKSQRVWYLLMLLICSFYVRAQNAATETCASLCCTFDPTPAGVMISHVHEKGKWMLSYRYMNMAMGEMQVGTTAVNKQYVFREYLMTAGRMNMDMHMLMAMTGLTDRLTLMTMFHYQAVSMRGMEMRPGSQHQHSGQAADKVMDSRMRSSGLGDTKVHLLLGLLNQEKHHLVLSAGASLPTGSINQTGSATTMYPGLRLPYAMRTGSGTFDVLPGLSYLYRQHSLTLGSQLSTSLRTGKSRYGYRYGNEKSLNAWAAWQWAPGFSTSLRAEAISVATMKGRDSQLNAMDEPAADATTYGGDKLNGYLGAGLSFNALLRQRLSLEYGIPLYQNLYGPQMKSRSALTISWDLSF